ncbi:PKD domain-containing protein [Daejeonella sp.]|uniref:PKD domain-containing protein n=1 Tax=Daejeonella sp. TaxID=2805397 RepID=UPI0037C087CF
MKKFINKLNIVLLIVFLSASACTKEEYSFGDLSAPAQLTLQTVIQGVNASNLNGDGTGKVSVTLASSNTINYKVDFGDGQTQMLSPGTVVYKYTTPGTNEFTITVNAIGKGGTTSTISKKIKVFVAFEIPSAIIAGLTGGTSKVWVTDNGADAHFGVGPSASFFPDWYTAKPNERDPEMYNDEITFTKDANNNINMIVDNKGLTFMIGAATSYYGFSGGDGNYALNTGGSKKLIFMDATSASTTANSTRIQFTVPGNGIINAGVGSTTYEILSVSATKMNLRTIGADGNAWYQKLKVK